MQSCKNAIQPIVDTYLDHRHLGTDLISVDKTFIGYKDWEYTPVQRVLLYGVADKVGT